MEQHTVLAWTSTFRNSDMVPFECLSCWLKKTFISVGGNKSRKCCPISLDMSDALWWTNARDGSAATTGQTISFKRLQVTCSLSRSWVLISPHSCIAANNRYEFVNARSRKRRTIFRYYQCFSKRRIVRCQLIVSVDSARVDVVWGWNLVSNNHSYVCSISLKLSISQYRLWCMLSIIRPTSRCPSIYDYNPTVSSR